VLLATAANALDLAVEGQVLLVGGIVRIAEVFFDGTWVGPRLTVATGASRPTGL